MTDIFRTLILPANTVQLARDIASALSPAGSGMWTTALSSDNITASHYISTGFISEDFAYMVPEQVWQEDENANWILVETLAGNPEAVYDACTAAGMQVTLADIEAVFLTADVTTQEPFTAMSRLNLQLLQEDNLT